MATTRPVGVLRGRRPGVAWAATLALVAAAFRLLSIGEPDWAAFVVVVVGVALLPPVIERDPKTTMPGELLALVTIPVVLRAVGVVSAASPFLVTAGLALLVAIALGAYTSLALTARFAVVLVVVTTMAFTAVWVVGTWVSDALLGTEFVAGQTELMWDVAAATGAGVLAGVAFELYFRFSIDAEGSGESGASRDGSAGFDDDARRRERTDRRVNLPGDERQQRLAVNAMRGVLAFIAVVGLVRLNVGLLLNGAITLAVTFVPAFLRREYRYPMDVGLTMWVTAAVLLHAVGVLGPYREFAWYHSVAHALSATLIAGVGYALARAVELHSDGVDFEAGFRDAFVVLFVLAAGVAWELLEFASGGVASVIGGRAALVQYGTSDVVNDLVFNAVGGVVIAALTTGRFEAIARSLADRVGVLTGEQ
ncbi:hypothetical protein [Halorarum halobium]|uniref:hypothetical protein n=1 Tax=Halorarum halobium TaxID=3075121 RepID=UPI0028AD7F9B|nr:hypothetical protein [Halobaculum sp. XH14]